MTDFIGFIEFCAAVGAVSFCIADIVADLRRTELSRYYRAFVRPIHIWGFCPTLIAINLMDGSWFIAAIWLVNMLMAYWRRNDDDDFWKKRRKKLAAKVKEVAGKLVVVPVPAGVSS